MLKSEYLKKVYADVEARNAGEKEFLQAVYEVLVSIEPVVESNPEYAEKIGADFYAKDAMAAVRYAEEIEKDLKEINS